MTRGPMRTPIEPLANPYHAGTLPEEAWHGLLRKDAVLHNDVARLVRQRLVVTFHVPATYDHSTEEPTASIIGPPVAMPLVRPDGDWHMDTSTRGSSLATYLFLPHKRGYERGRSCATGYIPGMVAHAVLQEILQTCQHAKRPIRGAEELLVFQRAIDDLGAAKLAHSAAARSAFAAMETLYRARWGVLPAIHQVSYLIHREFSRICTRIKWLRPGILAFFADDKGIHSALKPTRKVPPVSLILGHARYRNHRRKKAV